MASMAASTRSRDHDPPGPGLKAAFLQAGQIQDVPDQAEGMASPSEDLPGDLPNLFLVEGAGRLRGTLFQSLGPEGHTVKGVSQIVVHIGVEAVPGPVGGFQLGQKPFALGEEAGVFDGHGSLGRQHLDDGLVLLREGLALGFVDEVEVADGLAPDPDRHTQEGRGDGMALGHPGDDRGSSEARQAGWSGLPR